jgi:hypothetical protein
VDVTFAEPVGEVIIQFIQGTSSILGIDDFNYTTTPSAVTGALPGKQTLAMGSPWPNPVPGSHPVITIPVTSQHYASTPADLRMELWDPEGRRVAAGSCTRALTAGVNLLSWDIGTPNTGMYFVRLWHGAHACSRRIVVTR